MSVGLLALLDDVAAIAKVAAASLDDVVAQTARAGVKAAGVVIDDAAVTPRYVVGFRPSRELPIVAKIAAGSLFNKLVILLPAALALSAFLPSAITPLLMGGGAYLCYEGVEKIAESVLAGHGGAADDEDAADAADPADLERRKVAGAIKTDLILSAEIMAITLAAVPEGTLAMRAVVLALVGIAITLAVYGGVALIVKADDVGLALARADRAGSFGFARPVGRALVASMPVLLSGLGIVGTAAMVWVGGGIILHGLAEHGWGEFAHGVEGMAGAAEHAAGATLGPALGWIVSAAVSGLLGLVVGACLLAVVRLASALWRRRIAGGSAR